MALFVGTVPIAKTLFVGTVPTAETLFVGTVSMAEMLHVHRYQEKYLAVIRGETIVLNCSPSEAAVEME